MSPTPQEIRGFFEEAECLAARSREIREAYAAMRERAKKKQLDWIQLKALATAYDADKNDEKNKRRVAKLISKAEYACWYAEILKLDKDEQVAPTRSSSEPKSKTAVSDDIPRTDSGEAVSSASVAPRPPAGGAASLSHDPNDINDLRNHSFHRGPKAVA